MRNAPECSWQRWRVAPAEGPATTPTPRFYRRGADGIRHELVARVRAEIAAGTYDTEARWLAAEAALLRRVAAE